ncbi:hypothetical protein, partial [Leptospira alexanderi]|uniref:hypothetical protein n=1 Tax=Leptospira alexanderi TaxID=100053 RepID=UPI00147D4AC1
LTKLFSLAKVGRSFSANDIPNSSSKLISSAEANEFFIKKGFNPPFGEGYNGYEIVTSESIKAVRFFNKDNPYGGFLALPGDVAGKSASDIQKILGLPKAPSYRMDVEIPAGTRILYGKVGPQPNWGAPNFGTNQIFLIDRIPQLNYKVLTTERLPY